jgi:hypothetical protein
MEPDIALAATITIEIAVMVSGLSSGYERMSMGTRIKPPPAPIKVPNIPIKNPVIIRTTIVSIDRIWPQVAFYSLIE